MNQIGFVDLFLECCCPVDTRLDLAAVRGEDLRHLARHLHELVRCLLKEKKRVKEKYRYGRKYLREKKKKKREAEKTK